MTEIIERDRRHAAASEVVETGNAPHEIGRWLDSGVDDGHPDARSCPRRDRTDRPAQDGLRGWGGDQAIRPQTRVDRDPLDGRVLGEVLDVMGVDDKRTNQAVELSNGVPARLEYAF